MVRGAWLMIVAVFFSLPGASPAQQPQRYILRLVPPGKGAETTMDLESRFRLAAEKWDAANNSLGEHLSVRGVKMSLVSTILDMKGDEATRWRRRYTRLISTANGEEQQDPMQGQTVLFSKKPDGKYEVVNEKGEPLPKEQVARLEAQFAQASQCMSRQETIVPNRSVRVGDTWPIDASSWGKRDDAEVTLTRATGHLVKVYKKGARLFGVIDARAEFAIKTLTVTGRKMQMEPGARIVMKSLTDACIDGSSCECVEKSEMLLLAVVKALGADGLPTKMDQEVFIRATQSTK